jgi:hypothetical protein
MLLALLPLYNVWSRCSHCHETDISASRVHLRDKADIDFAGGFLHYITDDWDSKDKFPGTGWANTEFRSYTFDLSRYETRHSSFHYRRQS